MPAAELGPARLAGSLSFACHDHHAEGSIDMTVDEIRLNKFVLSRASLRARRMNDPIRGGADVSAEPRHLIEVVVDRRDALRAAEELYAIALSLQAEFCSNWTVDLTDAIENGDMVCLRWHERLILEIDGDNRIAAIEALANVQWQWGRHFHDDHGWARNAARHTQRIADWLLVRPRSVP